MTNKIKQLFTLFLVILGCLTIAGVFILLNQEKIEKVETSSEDMAQKAIDYINKNMLSGDTTASLVSIVEESGLYKIHIKIGEEEYDSYVSKDGKLLFPSGFIKLEEAPITETSETEESESTSENTIPPEELTEFIYCLKDANFVIYGANWCGWTKKLTDMLGGFDVIESIYVECTEKEELCEEKEVTGYPTILINGEKYQGERTFKEIAAATNCEIPPGAESISEESSGGGGCQ
jgi:glutaredoxin